MSRFSLRTCLVLLIGLLLSARSEASHIVGGEVTYRCLGGNRYEIALAIYRDCIGGINQAIQEDEPAFISIFRDNGIKVLSDSIQAEISGGQVVPTNFSNSCVTNPPNTCLNRIVFRRTYTLDNSATGYKVIYQRCCRNASIINILDPSSYGTTNSCHIPIASNANCNNSAVFKNFPPQIICINNPLVYDHGATDADGDSLSYEFCEAYGGGSNNMPKPWPEFRYDALSYRPPYTATQPMAGNPTIKIDPKTGMITGTPILQGRFVVSVCCHEWRQGVLINTVTREFQFVVTNCSKTVVADIPQYSQEFNTYIVNCQDYTVKFDNHSTGGITWDWDFGVKESVKDTSSSFEPTFVYPDSGTYVVRLIVNKGTTCSDSISRFVKVYPRLTAKFTAPTPVCIGDTVRFTNTTSSSYELSGFLWNFDDYSALDTNENPYHIYKSGGLYNVGLQAFNKQGCLDTTFNKVLVDPIKPSVGRDTTIVRDERIYFDAKGGIDYLWTPATYLSAANIPNPVGWFTEVGTFQYVVSSKSEESGCRGYDTITVKVLPNPYLAMPNAFTPNGDGRNDIFRPLLVGYKAVTFLRVFNRYGEEVFYTKDIESGWDGTYKGMPQVMGVYFWVMGVRDRHDVESQLQGDVTLIR